MHLRGCRMRRVEKKERNETKYPLEKWSDVFVLNIESGFERFVIVT